MLLCQRLLPTLLFIFYVQLRYCNGDDEGDEELNVHSSSYTISCAARKEISPCTCYQDGVKDMRIKVICQKMTSFNQIIQTLRNKIERSTQIQLVIEFSDLEDLSDRKFSDIESQIILIWLRRNKMKPNLSTKSFEGIDTVTTLMLIESKISEFPGTIFQHMPNVELVTIERTFIESISPADFKSLTKLKTLIIRSCNLTYIENDTFPPTLIRIDLDKNNISTLNSTLRNNTLLEWVFLSNNNIESLEGQLADFIPNYKLALLDVSFNKLSNFPKTFVELYNLNMLWASNNKIRNLDGIFRNKRELMLIDLAQNQIEGLASNEFENCNQLTHLNLSYNAISSLNRSLVPLESLQVVNLTYNNLTQFTLYEIAGLKNLNIVDLAYNKLRKFIAFSENETQVTLEKLHLEFNELEALEGFMAGVKGLKYLNVSNNKLTSVRSEFLDGLDALQQLDISYNQLLTLHDISKAKLPALGSLYATNNQITEFSQIAESKLSAVCFLYLQNNKIDKVNVNFAEKNQCVHEPGVDYLLYVYLDGNDVLCKDNIQETINSVEKNKNNTKIIGQCASKIPIEGIKYNVGQPSSSIVNNTDSSSITVVTLEH